MTINTSYQLPIIGNLIHKGLADDFDVIVHGCNCFHTMGAGIALEISSIFPEALAADQQTLHADRNKLGQISVARDNHTGLFIVNAYTQYSCYGQGPHVDYNAIADAFRAIAITFNGLRIGYPLIGCGLAGGDWKKVQTIIDGELRHQWHQLVVFNQKEWDKTFGV